MAPNRSIIIIALAVFILAGCAVSPATTDPGDALMTGAAWDRFADRVRDMGQIVQQDAVPKTPLEVAEGYRFLLAQLAEEIEVSLYRSDLEDPVLRQSITKFRSLAIPTADGLYRSAQIEDSGVYRVWGTMGTAGGSVSFQFYDLASAQRSYDLKKFVDADSHFDIQIGGREEESRSRSWVPMPEGATLLLFREYFSDWDTETRSRLLIDRLNRRENLPPITPEEMAAVLERVNDRHHALITMFMKRLMVHREELQNRLLPATPIQDVGTEANLYGPGWFRLAEDEALVWTVDPSDADYWSLQLGNFWGEAIDFVKYPSSITGAQASASSDGKYRIVIALTDPGVPNWLDTAGHTEGLLFSRFQGIEESPAQSLELVKLSDLAEVLPEDTPSVSRAERSAALRRRQDHMVRRWAP